MLSEISVRANVVIKLGREEFCVTEAEAKEPQAQLNALFPNTAQKWWYPCPAPEYLPYPQWYRYTIEDGTGGKP